MSQLVGDPPCTFDVERIREEFPILRQKVHGKDLVYLDNAASTQKPQVVIDAVAHYYQKDNANIHRGVHELSQRATEAYEQARKKIRSLIHAKEEREMIFVRGTTEAVNLVAWSFFEELGPEDEILISHMEHHSNIVPWQMLCDRSGARLKVIPIDDVGDLCLEDFDRLLGPRTKMLSVCHVSNALGTVNPIADMIEKAHERGVPVFIDGAQGVQHTAVDVQALDCDFYAFSGHKMYGPTGIGALYGKAEHLERMRPYQGGGDMILSVSFEGTTYNELPHKFEAGTPNIAGVVGLGVAADYLMENGLESIAGYEADLLNHAHDSAREIPGLRIMGEAKRKASVLSFTLDGIHPHDIGTILDEEGIAVRTGHHCAQPVMDRFGVPATARISLGLYNTRRDVDAALQAIRRVQEVMG